MMTIQPKHSLIAVVEETSNLSEDFISLMQNGIQIILFSKEKKIPDQLKQYQAIRLLQVFQLSPQMVENHKKFLVLDGQLDVSTQKQFAEICAACPAFNQEQYFIEHAPADVHLSIEAGAGTGKTTVMVQRVLFLIHTANMPLREMAMITFTREAAQRMFHKLREVFYERYQVLGTVKYLGYIEDLRSMQISTIHSFAKQLMKDIGTHLGFGQSVQIRGFSLERKVIIESLINKFAQKWMKDQSSIREKMREIPLYKLINTLDSYWSEFERKGLSKDEIAAMEWGGAPEESTHLHDIIKGMFADCEEELQRRKISTNSISLSDLTRQVELASRNASAFQASSRRLSMVFIDEFQDTDDSQIKLAVRLSEAFRLQLFVVGDIKQSIYRFRGADYTAFDNLRKQMEERGQNVISMSLVKNYRSASELLEAMDVHFTRWGQRDLLTYKQKDRLIGTRPSSKAQLRIERVNFERYIRDQQRYIVNLVKEAVHTLEEPEKQRIALLVRTNEQAMRLRKWFDEDTEINYHLDIGGTFFNSEAVRELKSIVEALLYPRNATGLLNAVNSSYSRRRVPWTELLPLHGEPQQIISYIHQLHPITGWEQALRDLRTSPVLAVLRNLIDQTQPVTRCYHVQLQELEKQRPGNVGNKEEALRRSKQYQKNMNHLFELIHQQLGQDFLTLYRLHEWLELQTAVNRDEDEPALEDHEIGARVRIMTVHKAKGMEFHTVLLPFTEKTFRVPHSELLLEKRQSTWSAGWQYKEGQNVFASHYYNELNTSEESETEKEETRLLYVAMTRAEERLWIVSNQRYYFNNNWHRLLSI